MKLETLAVHAGRGVEPATGAVTPSITLATTFERAEDGSFPHGNLYTRSGNPNRAALESAYAALEGGGAAQESIGKATKTQEVIQRADKLRILRCAGRILKIRPVGGNQRLLPSGTMRTNCKPPGMRACRRTSRACPSNG